MNVYTLAAIVDVPFLISTWLLARRFGPNPSGRAILLMAVLGPLFLIGLAYLSIFLAIIGPTCPDGRWAC